MPTLTRRLGAFAALLLLPLTAACASGGEDGYDAGPRGHYATLIVENDNTSNVTVYALRSGSRQRMGSVNGLSTASFQIRRTMLSGGGELNVGIHPLGSNRMYTAYPIYVDESDVIEVRVSSFLRE